jgi:rod shape-determining protein MreC
MRYARGRGNAQLPLAIVAVLAVVLVLVGKAQSSLFDRARASFTDWTRPALEWVSTPFDQMSAWFDGIGEIFVVYQENQRLKQENARLRQWQSAALLLDERLKRYQLLLNAVPDPALNARTARVIGRASHPFLDTMIIDAGKGQGIKPGQAVVDARGMIGRIFLSGERTSWVLLLTDLNSRIPVTLHPGNIQAIMAGDNSPNPTLETLATTTQPKAGDQVVTSGDGGLIPPGIPVGVLIQSGGGFRVALLADAAASQDVRIVDFKLPPEQPPAPSPNDLPATAAGLKPEPPAPAPAPQTAPPQAAPAPQAGNAPKAAPPVKPPAAKDVAKPAQPASDDNDDGDTQDQ